MDDIRRFYNNRFVLFYTLKWLWKKYNHPIPELYRTLFDSTGKGNNRSLYDRVLHDNHSPLSDDRVKRLEEITGIDKKYFIGEQVIPCAAFVIETWDKFISLRKKRKGGEKTLELLQIESEIIRQLTVAEAEKNVTKDFEKLVYFAKHKRRSPEKSIVSDIQEIEEHMNKLSSDKLAGVEASRLEEYRRALFTHYERIDALCVVNRWKKNELAH